jgi:hypothetical protein
MMQAAAHLCLRFWRLQVGYGDFRKQVHSGVEKYATHEKPYLDSKERMAGPKGFEPLTFSLEG